MGSNNIEAGHIVGVSEHVKEMVASFKTLTVWGKEPSQEAMDKWFDGGSADTSGMAVRAGQPTRYLNWWMARMEHTIGGNGFAVGKKLSLADILLYNVFMDTLSPEQTARGVPRFRCEPFCNKARTDAALAKHPKILASCNSVASHPNIQKWLAMRGVQTF
jgi:hypothetical protein